MDKRKDMTKQRVGRNVFNTTEIDPLDDLKTRKKAAEDVSSRGLGKPAKEKEAKKVPLTVTIPPELLERARNAVYWSHGLTLAKIVEQGLIKEIDRLEKNHGKPFPGRGENELVVGRRQS
jgi:post-segregation antitoxin (ccd killing protein)